MPFFWSNGSWSVIPHWVRCEAFLPGFSFAREPQVLTDRSHRLSTNKVRWHACFC